MRTTCLIAILLVVTATASSLWSQNQDWTLYTDGSKVTCVTCVGDTAWVGTEGGLCKIIIPTGESTFYNISNSGLPSNFITCIGVDDAGRKWIGTNYYGLVCFDDNDWTLYNSSNSELSSNQIRCLAFDNQDRLWVGAIDGLDIYDGNTWILQNPVSPGDSFIVNDMCFDTSGTLWLTVSLSGDEYLTFLVEKRVTGFHTYDNQLIEPGPNSLTIDSDGNKWVRMFSGVARFNNNNWQMYPPDTWSIPDSYITALTTDNQNNLWMSSDNGLIKYDGTNWFVYNPGNSELVYDNTLFVQADNQSNIWVLSEMATLPYTRVFQKVSNEIWSVFPTSNSGLHNQKVNCISVDSQDNLWIGAFNHSYDNSGLVKYDGNTWECFTTGNSGLPSNNVTDIAFDSMGSKWITMERDNLEPGGFVRFDGTNWTVFLPNASGTLDDRVEKVTVDNLNRKWVTTYGGYLARLSASTWDIWNWDDNHIIPYQFPNAMKTDAQNNLYTCNFEGLLKFDGGTWTMYNSTNTTMPVDAVNDMEFSASGDKWISTGGGGLIYSSVDGFTIYNMDNSGIPSNYVDYLAVDSEDNVWMVTEAWGDNPVLTRFDGTYWSVFTPGNSGFPEDYITCLTIDQQDRIWMGTLSGLCLFNGNVVGNEDNDQYTPENMALQCFPNPFSSISNIKYDLRSTGKVDLSICNIKGQLVRNIYAGNQKSGSQSLTWDGKDNKGAQSATGVYFVCLRTDKMTISRKVMLIKG